MIEAVEFQALEVQRAELENILKQIISKTSKADIAFHWDFLDINENSSKTRSLQIEDVNFEIENFKIFLTIQLIGYVERWQVAVCLETNIQEEAEWQDFPKEIKEAVEVVRQESRRKKVTRVASLITDDVVLSILKAWRIHFPGQSQITQRNFWEVLTLSSNVLAKVGRNAVLNFLQKDEVVRVLKPEPRKCFVELRKKAYFILEKAEEQKKQEALRARREELFRESRKFPAKALPLLEVLQRLQDLQSKLEELRRKKGEITKEISDLHSLLADLETEEEGYSKEVEKLIASIRSSDLRSLMGAAQDLEKATPILRKKKKIEDHSA